MLDYSFPYDKLNYLYYIEHAVPPRSLHPKISALYWFYISSEALDSSGHRDDEYSDYSTYSQNWIVPAFAFGAGDVLELGLAIPILMEVVEARTGAVKDASSSGVGDILIWAKASVTEYPRFGFRLAVKLPSGDDEFSQGNIPTGTGQTDFDFGLQFSHHPEKMGFMSDISVGYRLRLEGEKNNIPYKPGSEGRLGIYTGGMPIEGFGILFGGDGFISFNDEYDGEESIQSYRATAMIGVKIFYITRIGLKFDAGFKTDIAGKDVPAGNGFSLSASFEPKL